MGFGVFSEKTGVLKTTGFFCEKDEIWVFFKKEHRFSVLFLKKKPRFVFFLSSLSGRGWKRGVKLILVEFEIEMKRTFMFAFRYQLHYFRRGKTEVWGFFLCRNWFFFLQVSGNTEARGRWQSRMFKKHLGVFC